MKDKFLVLLVAGLAASLAFGASVATAADSNSATTGATVGAVPSDTATPTPTVSATTSAQTPSPTATSTPTPSPTQTQAPVSSGVGGWALVDANGNVLTVAVCTYEVCGDPNSVFRQLTLGPGQNWVLQTLADPNSGNVAGWGQNTTYDQNTNSFNLPGGGTLKSGSLIEEAKFPTPTPMPGATSGATVGVNSTDVVDTQTYESNSGVVYQTAAAFITGEAKVFKTATKIVVDLPAGLKQSVVAKVYFTPTGAKKAQLVSTSTVKPGKDLSITSKKIVGKVGKLVVKFLTSTGKISEVKKNLTR